MNVGQLVKNLPLRVLCTGKGLEHEITGGFVSDLLSNVMGQAAQGNVWVTMQGHQNIVAVASLTGISAIIVAGDVKVDEEAILKARQQDVILLSTSMPAFEVIGRMYELGIKGQ